MENTNKPENHGLPWARDELILAFDLYCRIPFKKTKANNPGVIELAGVLKRTSASIARKLGNFGSFDPELSKRKISGLPHASRMDKEIWDAFHQNWNQLVLEAKQIKRRFRDAGKAVDFSENLERPEGPGEREVIRKARVHQSFFRDAILSSYDGTCCITGLKIRQCLVASHIIPWSQDERHRTDPRNGLCLSATFDRLFESGLMTISKKLTIQISTELKNDSDPKTLKMISCFHGRPIFPPHRFLPSETFLEWHRRHVFR
ncbi:MAG: HNH endonuclease [Desulfococcaceae bacterium]